MGGLVTAMLLGASVPGQAQQKQRKQPQRARRETNASRQARIARTIQQTYAFPWEIVGGGGYLRWRSGPYTRKNNEVNWNATVDRYLTPRLGIVGEAQGSFGHAYQQLPLAYPQIARPQINEYFFTGGAAYRFYERQEVAIGVQGTGGVAWGIFSGGAKGLTGQQVGLWPDGFRPAFTAQINADFNVYPNLGLRVSPMYVGTTFGGQTQSNLGINAGVLYRFGTHK
jgi:hypothetical protein